MSQNPSKGLIFMCEPFAQKSPLNGLSPNLAHGGHFADLINCAKYSGN